MIDPEMLLTAIKEVLASLQTISGLKLNKDKSLIYPILMNEEEIYSTQQKYSYA